MTTPRVLAAGLGVVVVWASAFPAIRVAAPALGVIGLSFTRLAIAAVALLIVAPIFKVRLPAGAWRLRRRRLPDGAWRLRRRRLPDGAWRLRRRRLPDAKDLPSILACGFFGMAAYQILLNWGELDIPAGTASIIVAAAPLVSVAIAAAFLGERLTITKIIGSAVAITGVVVVCLSRSGFSLSTALLILVGAMVVQGIYHPLTKPLLKKYSGLEVATYGMVGGTIMLLPTVPFGWDAVATADASAWWAAIYLGLLPSAMAFVLWGYAVARLPVATSTSLLYLVPPVAVLIAYPWLGEIPYPSELLGGLVVIAGVLTVSLGDRLWAGRKRRQALELPAGV